MSATHNQGFNDVLESVQNADVFNTSNTKISDFLYKTSQDVMADTVDPLNTFDVEFLFSPSLFCDDGTSIYEFKELLYDDSFLKKLTETIMQVGKNPRNLYSSTLTLLLGYYILSMTVPNMVMPEAGKVPTLMGEFPVNNLYVKADNNQLQMEILNTKVSLHDYIFYPWMREVTLPLWSYEKQPYTTANITIKFDKHSNSRYVFCGCRPSQINSRLPTQEPDGEPTRSVTMLFDYMYITDVKSDSYVYGKDIIEEAYKKFSNKYDINSRLNMPSYNYASVPYNF